MEYKFQLQTQKEAQDLVAAIHKLLVGMLLFPTAQLWRACRRPSSIQLLASLFSSRTCSRQSLAGEGTRAAGVR